MTSSISYVFLGRISDDEKREAGITFHMDWAEAKHLLKERFGGARRPVYKHVMQILALRRGYDESASDYAKRMGEETMHLRTRVREKGHPEHETQARIAAYEELVRDTISREVTDKLQAVIKLNESVLLEEIVSAIWDEETAWDRETWRRWLDDGATVAEMGTTKKGPREAK